MYAYARSSARTRLHRYSAIIATRCSPFVGGPQDDCVTSRAEGARPRVGRQRSRPVGCVEQYCCVRVCARGCARAGLAVVWYGRGLGGGHGWRRKLAHVLWLLAVEWLVGALVGAEQAAADPSFGFDRKRYSKYTYHSQSPPPPAQLSTTLPSHQATIHQSTTTSSAHPVGPCTADLTPRTS